MPVTINPASHRPKSHPPIQHSTSLVDFLRLSCQELYLPSNIAICASSFNCNGARLYPSASSFIRSAIEAWGRHAHLVLRPDDVWFTILVQMSFFMEANSELLRDIFVCHEDQEKILCSSGDWNEVLMMFREKLPKKFKVDWMSDWITPGFSTSTFDDEITATVLMIWLMKGYLDYYGDIICGIPSITLLGEKTDWQRLSQKTQRLADFGDEPKHYASRLQPVLSRIVKSFDDPTGVQTRSFWDQMVHAKVHHTRECGKPPNDYILSGWILGFFHWKANGQPFRELTPHIMEHLEGPLVYDGVSYGRMRSAELPVGYAKAKFTMMNCHPGPAGPFHGWILAGNIGNSMVDGAPDGYEAISGPVPEQKHNADHAGCLSGLFQSLHCFPKNQDEPRSKQKSTTIPEKSTERRFDTSASNGDDGHSTIQPMSGWMLFGPEKSTGTDCWGKSEEGLWGSTVDAINSCEGLEHTYSPSLAEERRLDAFRRGPPVSAFEPKKSNKFFKRSG